MRLAWATDIHLDVTGDTINKVQSIANASRDADAILITGDISVSNMILQHLSMLEMTLEKQIYFVLGNHDYYGSNFGTVRRAVNDFCGSSSYLKYMSSVSFMRLSPGVSLVGHDGWYDGQNGNPHSNALLMNDWIKISDFNAALRGAFGGQVLNKRVIIEISCKLAQQAVNHVANGIKAAVKDSNHIIVMTHVPPFKESFNAMEKYVGMSVNDVLPWYTCKLMGDTLLAAAKTYSHVKFTVLSGHAHSHYDDDLLNNLNVKVGRAIYGNPQLASSISI